MFCSAKLVAFLLFQLFFTYSYATNHAILIGVGRYQDALVHQLEGPSEDVRALKSTLVTKLGFSADQIVTLLDAQATKKNILDTLNQVEGRSKEGDFILIYFSGHGTSYHDADFGVYASLPYASGAWLPFDTQTNPAKDISGSIIGGRRDLRPILEKLDQKGRRVLVISDSCFSGQLVRGIGGSGSKFVALPGAYDPLEASAELGNRKDPPPYPYHHVTMLSAANENEPAQDINSASLGKWPTIDGKPHGTLTDALLRVLNGELGTTITDGGATSLASVHRTIDNFMNSRSYGHSPQILPSIREDDAGLLTQPWPGLKGVAKAPMALTSTAIELAFNNASLREQLNGLGGVKLVTTGSDLRIIGDLQQIKLLNRAGDVVNESMDPAALVRRVEAEVWTRNKIPDGKGNFTLLTELDPNVHGGNYLRCETLALNIRVSQPAWLMVIDLASDGKFSVLYPASASELHAINANAFITIPGSRYQDRIQVGPPYGVDHLYVFAFSEKPVMLDQLINQQFQANQSLGKTLAIGLQSMTTKMQVQKLVLRTSPNPVLMDSKSCPAPN